MKKPTSLTGKVIVGSFIALSLTFFGSAFAYLLRIIYSRTMTIEDYGLFYATFGFVSMFTTFADLGFGYSVSYLMPKYIKLKKYSKAWTILIYTQAISLGVSLLVAIGCFLTAPYLAKHYLKVEGSEYLIYVFSIYLITFAVINGLILAFSGLQKPKYFSSITLIRWLMSLVLSGVFLLFFKPGAVEYAVAWTLGHIFTVAIFLFFLYKHHSFLTLNRVVWDKKEFKKMFSLAFPAMLETFVVGTFATDTIFLVAFRGVRDVGIYNIIYPLATIPVILLAPLNTIFLTLTSHLMEGEKVKVEYLVKKILEIVPFIGLYFGLFTAVMPSYIVRTIFGEKWSGLVETPLTILALGTITVLLNNVLGSIILGFGKVKQRLKATTTIAVINVVLNAVLIWYFGILGVVIAASFSSVILSAILLRILKTEIKLKIPYGFYLKLFLFSLSFYLIVTYLNIIPKNIYHFFIFGIIYSIIFAVFGKLVNLYDKKLILMIYAKASPAKNK